MSDPSPGAIDIWGFVISGFTSIAGWLWWTESKRSKGDRRLHDRIDETNSRMEGIAKAQELVVGNIFREIASIRERLPERYATKEDIAALNAKMDRHADQTEKLIEMLRGRFHDLAGEMQRVVTKLDLQDENGHHSRTKGKTDGRR